MVSPLAKPSGDSPLRRGNPKLMHGRTVENGFGEIPVDFLMDTFTFTQDYPQGGAPVR